MHLRPPHRWVSPKLCQHPVLIPQGHLRALLLRLCKHNFLNASYRIFYLQSYIISQPLTFFNGRFLWIFMHFHIIFGFFAVFLKERAAPRNRCSPFLPSATKKLVLYCSIESFWVSKGAFFKKPLWRGLGRSPSFPVLPYSNSTASSEMEVKCALPPAMPITRTPLHVCTRSSSNV